MEKASFGPRVSADKSPLIQETESFLPRCCRLGTCHQQNKLNGNFDMQSFIPSKSAGSGMANSVVGKSIPFTLAQWNELQRQALIYNYMACSVPVPHDLLFPLSMPMDYSSLYNVGRSKNEDPDPGRCKRSDGKKWRCSKMAVPGQRYCEHHRINRGRHNRSRKLVESKNDVRTPKKVPEEQPLLFNANTSLNVSADFYGKGKEREFKHQGDRQLEHLVEANVGTKNESSSVYCYNAPDLNADQHMVSFPYPSFAAPETEYPIGYIDAWSVDNLESTKNGIHAESFVSPYVGNPSPSLTLSMAVADCNEFDKDIGNARIESRVGDNVDPKTENLSWLRHDSWEPFARGGPLGEVLHSGSVPASPYDSVISGYPATNVSSPSGVLHKTLFSQSDSSVCNSPTLAAPPSEITFQWFN